jgi:arginyl-tRNA synthetase
VTNVLSSDVRRAVRHAVAAAGFPPGTDPGLRPTGIPGQYGASVALGLGGRPRETARGLAAALASAPWIEKAEVTGPGYLTVTVTAAALAAVADRVTEAGPGCAESDALAGVTVPAPPPDDPLAAATWEEARAALAARLTARLAAAAGATVADPPDTERERATRDRPGREIAAAVAFAGRDAVAFALASAIPGRPVRVKPEIIARHVAGNPAYAVRYAHARAASGVRWALASAGETTFPSSGGSLPRETAVLLDALSWLPERVAVAARRGRPDEFARYLEELASVTVDVLSFVRHPGNGGAPGSGRLTLAMAARAGLAAGLGLLEVSAPERL